MTTTTALLAAPDGSDRTKTPAPSCDAALLDTPAAVANPYPFYGRLRAQSPVRYQRVFAPGEEPRWAYALLRHADVSAALRDHETFSSRVQGVIAQHLPMLQDDPPRHTQLRRRVSKAFTPKRVADLTPAIAGVARELADEMRGEVELMGAYAAPLPIRVIAQIIGVPDRDYRSFRRWTGAFLAYQRLPPAERAAQIAELDAYLRAQIAAPRPGGAEDLIGSLLETEVDGERLPEKEVLGLLYLTLIAGHETTVNLLGNMVGLLADRPDLWRRAREDRSLVEPIITEVLRFESPIQRLGRVTTRRVEVSGVTLPEGHLVTIGFGAANRDPAVFADPETFRVDRAPAEHLAFGQGIHFCIGAPLARVEARVTLNLLLDRFPTLERGADPAIRQTATAATFGYERLPLVLG
jgi:hypothetical protein